MTIRVVLDNMVADPRLFFRVRHNFFLEKHKQISLVELEIDIKIMTMICSL